MTDDVAGYFGHVNATSAFDGLGISWSVDVTEEGRMPEAI